MPRREGIIVYRKTRELARTVFCSATEGRNREKQDKKVIAGRLLLSHGGEE